MQSIQAREGPLLSEAVSLALPLIQCAPFVFASPHSGRNYPPSFIVQSKLDSLALRTSEDCFVDELFAAAPRLGAPLVVANFPRAYCDPNREPYELDPRMFIDPLPPYANTGSMRVASGLGTIAKVVGSGQEIYDHKITVAEALHRINTCYHPYHETLQEMIENTYARFSKVVIIDCHSMPSIGGPQDNDRGLNRPDIVLGDRFGTSCAPAITEYAERIFSDLGFHVRRNVPYAGGFTTHHYGQPQKGRHTLQIEINRGLYLDETTLTKHNHFDQLKAAMSHLIQTIQDVTHDLPDIHGASNIPLAT